MCGIAGVFGNGRSAAVARSMSGCLAHRGPDDEGVAELHDRFGNACGALAQRRLAIIDLTASGHQPMASADGRYVIVFNGEVYNYRELRSQLQRHGAVFHTQSDTEVLLAGVAREGHAFIDRLRGMFAFALWDRHRSRVLLARDTFGIKPLFLARREGQLAFASEARALHTSGFVKPVISRDAVAGYLAWGSVPEPVAMLDRVTMLPAGSVVEVEVARGRAQAPRELARLSPFGDGTSDVTEAHPERAASLGRAALRDSVRHHLVADVPVAVFLSGGIDSSVVAAIAAEESERRLDSFTIVFGEEEFNEAVHARAAARAFGTSHNEIPISGEEFFDSLPKAFASMDQPSMDGLNTYVVSRAVKRAGIKVVLSGLGGDELFAGYPSFRRALSVARWWRAVRSARRPLAALLERGGLHGAKVHDMLAERSPASAAYRVSRTLFPEHSIRQLIGRGGRQATAPPPAGLSVLQEVTWYELTGYMRNTLLRDSDVFSMAHGLELRVPFVDRGVVAASLAVSDRLKIERHRSKPMLVRALGDRLPREVWDRPKRGFALPFAHWMRGPLRAEVDAALSSPARLERVGLDPTAVRNVWRSFTAGERGMTWSRPWALYTLVRWAETVGATPMDTPSEQAALASVLAD